MKEPAASKGGECAGIDEGSLLAWIDEHFLKSFAIVQCLSLISKGHTHGYDIIKFFEKTYNVKISPGKIYPVLQWLEDKEYIKGEWAYTEGKPGKKTYALTSKGEEFLLEVKERLLCLVKNISVKSCDQGLTLFQKEEDASPSGL
ncbi:MAG: PadR family transcriptional regulator [Candidatus Altiarchaeia archaeon]